MSQAAPRGERRGTAAAGGCGCAVVAALILWLQVIGLGGVVNRTGLDTGLILALSFYIALIAIYITLVMGVVGAFWSAGLVRHRSSSLRIWVAFISVVPLSVLVLASTAFSLCVWHNADIGGQTFTTDDTVTFVDSGLVLLRHLFESVSVFLDRVVDAPFPNGDFITGAPGLALVDRDVVTAFVAAAEFVVAFAVFAPPAYALKRLGDGVWSVTFGRRRRASS